MHIQLETIEANVMGKKLEILTVGRDRQELAGLGALLSRAPEFHVDSRHVTNGHVDPLHGISTLPDVLLLCLSANWREELQALAEHPPATRPPVVVIAPSGDPQIMRLAMQAGARDFHTRPVDDRELLSTLQQMEQYSLQNPPNGSGLTVVINAKGGSGASMVAANLAHVMATGSNLNVALVDMDIQFGNLGLYLDLVPELGLLDALEAAEELDRVALQAYMTKHRSGVEVMATTHHQIALPGEIDVDRLNRLLDVLLASYDHVVIDLPRQIDLLTTTVLERAGHVVLCLQQNVTHIQDASRLRNILRDELGVTDQRMVLAVNRYDAKSAVTLADIRNNLEGPALVLIPNDFKRVSENVNLGIPLLEQSRSAPISKAINNLMREICGNQHIPRQGLLTRVLGSLHGA
ncbi:MAG: AAA family ATPase [Gammaproteobacteria bacterium]